MSEPLFVIDNKRVWCIDQATGEIAWNQSVGGLGKGGKIEAVLLDGGRLFVCTEFRLYCVDAQSGKQEWSIDLEGIAENKSLLTRGQPVVNRV